MPSRSNATLRTRYNGNTSARTICEARKRKGRATSTSELSGNDLKRCCTQMQTQEDMKATAATKLVEQCSLEDLSLEAHEHLDSPVKTMPTGIVRKKSLRSYNNKCQQDRLSELSNGNCMLKGRSPLPELIWADPDHVWKVMKTKENNYKRDPLYLQKHPSLQVRMRTILLDWLIEVCEVYRLHRETFHLAVDFVDRYLSMKTKIAKQRLQLIGVTALFVAAKIEEIYPPKVTEFAYVTDGACTVDEITKQELLILQALGWRLSPLTANSWLTTYLQINHRKTHRIQRNKEEHFEFPNYPPLQLSKVSQLVDLCLLDINALSFPYSIIASSCLHHIFPSINIIDVTGYSLNDIHSCIKWLIPFAHITREQKLNHIKQFDKIPADDAHNIQVHNSGLTLLDQVHERQKKCQKVENQSRTSPAQCEGILTPPSSTKKDY